MAKSSYNAKVKTLKEKQGGRRRKFNPNAVGNDEQRAKRVKRQRRQGKGNGAWLKARHRIKHRMFGG